MILIILTISILQFPFNFSQGKGIYSGVPCHRAYSCIFEDDEDGFENSLLVDEESNVETEELCQSICAENMNCVSYSWWNENTTDKEEGSPLLCQLFSVCHRSYHNPSLTPVHSGKSSKVKIT